MNLKSRSLLKSLGYELYSDTDEKTVYKQHSNWITFYKGVQPYFSFDSSGFPGFVDIGIVTAFLCFCEEQGFTTTANNDLGYNKVEVIKCT